MVLSLADMFWKVHLEPEFKSALNMNEEVYMWGEDLLQIDEPDTHSLLQFQRGNKTAKTYTVVFR